MSFNYRRLAGLLFAGCAIGALVTGCSDDGRKDNGSPSPTPTPTPSPSKVAERVLQFDSNGDNIPDVFEDATEEGLVGYLPTYEIPKGKPKNMASQVVGKELGDVYEAPARIRGYIWQPYMETYEEVDEKDDGTTEVTTQTCLVRPVEEVAFNLNGGQAYSLTVQDSRMLGEEHITINPRIRIIPLADYEEDEQAVGLPFEILNADSAGRSVTISFEPEESGTYVIATNDASSEIVDLQDVDAFPYTFSLYPDSEKFGSSVKFTSSDPEYDFAYTPEEIQDLRDSLAAYLEYDETTYLPTGVSSDPELREAAEEAFEETLDLINARYYYYYDPEQAEIYAKADEPSITKLEPTMTGFRWDASTFLGDGISALTGISPKVQSGAVEPFELPQEMGPTVVTTETKLVENKTSYEEAIGIKGSVSLSLPKAAFSADGGYSNKIKYSADTTTLLITYNYAEKSPRRLESLKSYELSPEAAQFLEDNGEEAFRKEYGDYFVGGATCGARYIGTLVIRANNSEKMSTIKSQINARILKLNIGAEFAKEMKSVTSGCSIEMHETAIGETWDDSAKGETAIDTLVAHYQSFKNNVENSSRAHNFDKLDAYLIGYDQITGGEMLSDSVNIPPSAFSQIRSISSNLMEVKAMVRAYGSEPDEHFVSGHKQKVTKDCDTLSTAFRSDVDAIKASAQSRDTWQAKIEKALQDITDLTGRYQLFSALQSCMKGMGTSASVPYGAWGVTSFLRFPAAHRDITLANSEKVDVDWKFAQRVSWDPTLYASGGGRICYFSLTNGCYSSYRGKWETTTGSTRTWDASSIPALCRRSISLHCVSDLTRGLYYTYQVGSLNTANYGCYAWTTP